MTSIDPTADAPRPGLPRQSRVVAVLCVVLACVFCVDAWFAWSVDSDPLEAAGNVAGLLLFVYLALMCVRPRSRLGVLGIPLVLGWMIFVFDAWAERAGRFVDVPSIDAGEYTLTLTVERSTDPAWPVGQTSHRVHLGRHGHRLFSRPDEGLSLTLELSGFEIAGSASRGAGPGSPSAGAMEGRCTGFGRAEGDLRVPGDGLAAFTGSFHLVEAHGD